MGRKSLSTIVFFMVIAVIAAGCSSDANESHNGGKIKITTTIGMITDVVKEVAGEHAQVTGLMKAGVDPHLYKASEGDTRRLGNADIIFYNGLHLEGKMVDILEKIGKKKPAIAVAERIDPSRLHAADPSMGGQYDPHVWFDVSLWVIATETIRDELMAFDPEHRADYERNAEVYLQKLRELDDYARAQIASIPVDGRVLVTAHDAFGYFGNAYDIEVRGLQGISTASEAGARGVAELRDYLVTKKIKAVFVESSVPRKNIDAVIQGAKQQGHEVLVGGELFSDAMGKDGTEEGTYIGMVRHNVDTIVKALR